MRSMDSYSKAALSRPSHSLGGYWLLTQNRTFHLLPKSDILICYQQTCFAVSGVLQLIDAVAVPERSHTGDWHRCEA
jgi:hypothetical protein